MKNSPIGNVLEELLLNQQSNSDKHLILRHGTPGFAAATISASTIAQKKFNTCCNPVDKARNLSHRRYNCLVHELRGLFHAIESAAHKFVGADYLQAGP